MRQIARNEALRLLDKRRLRSERELLDDETILSTVADDKAEQQREDLLRKLQVGRSSAASPLMTGGCLLYAIPTI